MTGRPSKYSQPIADKLCEELVEGRSLRRICLDDDMPAASTIFKWLKQNEDFAEQYARAREAQADTLADEIVDIADDGSNDYMGEDEKYNGDAVARSRLRVEARKWVAAKLKPKKYGEKLDLTSGGDKLPSSSVDVSGLSEAALRELAALGVKDGE